HGDVREPDYRDARAVGFGQHIAAIDQLDLAGHAVAVGVARPRIAQRLPAANVAPAHRHRHHRGAGGILHYRVVDRFLGADLGERARIGEERRAVLVAGRDRGAYRGGDAGAIARQLGQKGPGLEHEDAAVPAVTALREEALGTLPVGLL